jgi:hypothetical protein
MSFAVWLIASVGAHAQAPPAKVAAVVDGHIQAKLASAMLEGSSRSDDAEFLRRIYLHLNGRLPAPERVVEFLEDSDPAKRTKAVDRLLASTSYGEHFANYWATLITAEEPKYRAPLAKWLAEEFNKGTPWSRIVHEMLVHEGNGPMVGFVLSNMDNGQPQPNKLAGATGRLFLGMQIHCAECHNHPFASFKQEDFWGLAAFFGRTRYAKAVGKSAMNAVTEAPTGKEKPSPGVKPGSIVLPNTAGKGSGKIVAARLLDRDPGALPKEGALRPKLADWVVSPSNPYFAKAFANRLWAHFFGRGLVNPIDDIHDENLPSHPEVLDALAKEFTASGFDIKHLIRCICATEAYQRTSRPTKNNENDETLFSHQAVQVMNADVLYDALLQAYGVTALKVAAGPGSSLAGRPVGNASPRDKFIRLFNTNDSDSANTDYTHGIPQALSLMNDPVFNSGGPTVDKLKGVEPAKAVEGLFLATLSRRPTADEVELMTNYVARRGSPAQGYAGVLWILINTEEFVLIR